MVQPDAVVVPETAEVAAVAIEKIHKAGDLGVVQDLPEHQLAVVLEEIVLFFYLIGSQTKI